jgi:hypothetical protein
MRTSQVEADGHPLRQWVFHSVATEAGPVAVASGVTASPGTTILALPAITVEANRYIWLQCVCGVYNTDTGANLVIPQLYNLTTGAALYLAAPYRNTANQEIPVPLQAVVAQTVAAGATVYALTCYHSAAYAAAVVRVSIIVHTCRS